LTRERIVDAALQLVEAEGLAAFSTRKLGERLGCEAMSIYHHFPSKQHLLDALVEHALASVVVPPAGDDPLAAMRASLDSYRAMARRWPALFQLVALHRLNMPAGIRFLESILRLIHSVIGDDELTARHFRVMGYYLIGVGLEETAGYARGPSAADPVDETFIAKEAPLLARMGRFFQEPEWDATFRLGIDALIGRGLADAAQARAAAPAAATKRRKRAA
jgi:AcrR family transcriptional regulator